MTEQPKRNRFLAPDLQVTVPEGTPELRETDPTLAERFLLNARAGFSRATPEGAGELALQPGVPMDSLGNYDVRRAEVLDELSAYDAMRPSETALEYAAAIGGQLAGQAAAPSSYLFAPVKIGSAAFQAARPVTSRVLNVAVGNAIVSTAIDPAVQGLNLASGQQDAYSIEQTALAPVAGFVLGGAFGAAAEVPNMTRTARIGAELLRRIDEIDLPAPQPMRDARSMGSPDADTILLTDEVRDALPDLTPEDLDPVVLQVARQASSGVTQIAREEEQRSTLRPLPADDLQQAAQAVADGVDGDAAMPDTLGLFAGRNARTADLDALRRAEQLEGQGANRDAVLRQTGWFRGTDGKWRFEIADDAAAWGRAAREAKAGQTPLTGTVLDKIGVGRWVPGFMRRPLADKWTGQLGDVIDHPALFEAYPSVARVPVTINPRMDPATLGYYYKGQIHLSPRAMAEDAPDTLLHEIQHLLQEIEGHSGGASSMGLRILAEREFPEQYRAFNALTQEMKGLKDRADAGDQAAQARFDELRPQWNEQYLRLTGAPSEGYRRAAGEVEARNVTERREMTADQRGRTGAWETQDVPDAQQIPFTAEEFAAAVQRAMTQRQGGAPGAMAMSEGPSIDLAQPGFQRVRVGDTELDITVARDGRSVAVNAIRTPEEARGKGSARKALAELLRAADAREMEVRLTPEPLDQKTSKARLDRWYRRLGFRDNAGRDRDLSHSFKMVRAPQPPIGASLAMSAQARPALRNEARPQTRAASGAVDPIKGRRKIVGDLVKALDATVRRGITAKGMKAAAGVFDTKTGVVRVKNMDDLEVIAHEIGHDLHMRVIGKPMDDLVKAHAAELRALDYDPQAQRPWEGFAEWFRMFLHNPAAAQREAPAFSAAFDALVSRDHPEIAKALRDYQADVRAYIEAPSTARVTANVVSMKKPGALGTLVAEVKDRGLAGSIASRLSWGYAAFIDGTDPLRQAVRQLARLYRDANGKPIDLKAADDPYKLRRLMSDAYAAGQMDLVHGVHGYHKTDPETASLSDAMAVAMGQATKFGRYDDARAQEFGSYLISKRAVELYERFERGELQRAPTLETKGDHLQNIADLEAKYGDAFANAAAMVHEWTRGLLKKKFDAGLITRELYVTLLARDRFYVPFRRDMRNLKEDDAGGRGGQGRDLARDAIKRFRGSDRPIQNPVESLMADAFQTNWTIKQNDVVRALDRLATAAGPGGGAIAERIPDTKLRAMAVDPMAALQKALKRSGMDDADKADLLATAAEAFGEEGMVKLFRSERIEAGAEPIVFFWDGGERKALRLADGQFGQDMYQALIGMPDVLKDALTDLLAKPAAVFRMSITTSPEFLLANYIRDQLSAWVLTDNFTPFFSGARGLAAELRGSEAARIYNMAGGISGGAEVASLTDARVNADIQSLRRRGWLIERTTSLRGALQIAEVTETGTRLGVFQNAYKASLRQGLSPFEASLEAAYIARDYIDFGRRGSRMVGMSRVVPFLNASLQGLDKTSRTLFAPAVRYMRGDVLTAQDRAELGTSMKAWAKISVMTMFGAALATVYADNPDWQDAPATLRNTHWLIKGPDGKWLAVPKPFELAMPATIAERTIEFMQTQDGRAVEKLREGIFGTLLPPMIWDSPALKVPYEVITGVDSFSGRPIVPDYLKGVDPWLQYTAATSQFSRDIGQVTGLSPAYVDHVIVGFTASWGRNLLALYDTATGKGGAPGWDDMAITRRFIKDLSRGATSSRAFWDQIGGQTGRYEAAARTYEAMALGEAPGDAAAYLAKQPADLRAFIALRQDSFKADDRRLHPLVRARDLIQVLGDARRQLTENRQADFSRGTKIAMTPDQRRMFDDVLSKIQAGEARNALVLSGDASYVRRPLLDLSGDYETLKAISPQMAAEIDNRMRAGKVYDFEAVAAVWPEAMRRLLADGTDARLADLRGRAKAIGYQGDGRLRRAQERPVEVPGERAALN